MPAFNLIGLICFPYIPDQNIFEKIVIGMLLLIVNPI